MFLGLKLALGKLAKTLVSHDNERRVRTVTTRHLGGETTKVNLTQAQPNQYTRLY